jgi:hypothetical protein
MGKAGSGKRPNMVDDDNMGPALLVAADTDCEVTKGNGSEDGSTAVGGSGGRSGNAGNNLHETSR